MAWNKTYPTNSTTVSGSTAIIRGNWDAIDVWFNTEHNALSGAASGTHKWGQVPVLYTGTTAEIIALTSPESGALAYDTSLGTIKIKRSTWTSPTSACWSTAALTGDGQTVTSSTPTQKTLSTETFDLLGEASSSSFTASSDGYYLIIGNIHADQEASTGSSFNYASIYVNAAAVAVSRICRKGGDGHCVMDIRSLSAGDIVKLYYYTGEPAGGTLGLGGYLHVVRLS